MQIPSLETIEIESLELDEVDNEDGEEESEERHSSSPIPCYPPSSSSSSFSSSLSDLSTHCKKKTPSNTQRSGQGCYYVNYRSTTGNDRRCVSQPSPSASFSRPGSDHSIGLDLAQFKKHRNQCISQEKDRSVDHTDRLSPLSQQGDISHDRDLSIDERDDNSNDPSSGRKAKERNDNKATSTTKKRRWKLFDTASFVFAFLSQRKKDSAKDSKVSGHPKFPSHADRTRRHDTGTTHTTATTLEERDSSFRHCHTGKTFTRSSSFCSDACKEDDGSSFVLSKTSSSSSILLFDSRTLFSPSMVHAQPMIRGMSDSSATPPLDGGRSLSSSSAALPLASSSPPAVISSTQHFSPTDQGSPCPPQDSSEGPHKQWKNSSRPMQLTREDFDAKGASNSPSSPPPNLAVCIDGGPRETAFPLDGRQDLHRDRRQRTSGERESEREEEGEEKEEEKDKKEGGENCCDVVLSVPALKGDDDERHISYPTDSTAYGGDVHINQQGRQDQEKKKKKGTTFQAASDFWLKRNPCVLFCDQSPCDERKDDDYDFYYGSRTRRRRRKQFGWRISRIFESLRMGSAQAFSEEDERLYVEEILHFSCMQSIPVSLSILIIYIFYAVPRMMSVWNQIFFATHPSLTHIFFHDAETADKLFHPKAYTPHRSLNPTDSQGGSSPMPPDPASYTASLISFIFWSGSCLSVLLFVAISVFGTKMKNYEKTVCITTTIHFISIAFAECFQVLRLSFFYSSFYEHASRSEHPEASPNPPNHHIDTSSSSSLSSLPAFLSSAFARSEPSPPPPASSSSPSLFIFEGIGEEWSALIPDNVVLQFVFLIAIDFIYCIRIQFSQWIHLSCVGITLLLCIIVTIAITTLPTYRLASLWGQGIIACFVLICFHLATIALESERRRNFLHFELARKRVADLQRKIIGATEGKVAVVRLITSLKNMGTHLCNLHEDVSPDMAAEIEQLEALRLECLGIVTSSDNLYAVRTDLLPAEVLQMLQLHSHNGVFSTSTTDLNSQSLSLKDNGGRTRFLIDGEIIAPSFKELSHDLFLGPPDSRRASDTPHLFPRSPRNISIAGGTSGGVSKGSGCVSSLPVSPRGGPAASAVAASVPVSPRESSSIPAAPPSLSLEAKKARFSWSSSSAPPRHLPRPPLVEGVEVLTHVGTFWPIDMFKLNRQCEGNALVHVGNQLLQPFMASGYLQCDQNTLLEFLYSLQKLYKTENPYHSQIHGAMVAHLSLSAAHLLELFRPKPGGGNEEEPHIGSSASPCSPPSTLPTTSPPRTSPTPTSRTHHGDKTTGQNGLPSSTDPAKTSALLNHELSLLIAALGHDVGHPGRSNNFLINTSSNLSLVYNDKSVLENYHSCLTFYTLSLKSCNIFKDKSLSEYRTIRKQIIELILSTDMSQHFETITRVAARRESPDFDFREREDDRLLIMSVCIKTADIGHCALDWEQHEMWSKRVAEEFFSQGDEEKRLGLAVSPLCDRLQQDQLPKNQANFIELLFLPLVNHLGAIAPDEKFAHTVIARAKQNALTWKSKLKTSTEVRH
ncbi:3 5 -cyclic nucleotide phosphodiesterase domain-containing protein [Cystoisospora suis]|uniref:Phosphodiesterase n=1 Tax=Cystoisospora suis TaxID=483139 RepID=A0A2C6KN32_9APIC|nr:3 5 -cyclic nucleotide phosphodiesterase domain-containing protein [Cystoisospora suis]